MDFRLILESDEVRRILEEASARTRDVLQLVARQNIVPPHTDLAALSAMPWEKLPFDLRKVMAPALRPIDLHEEVIRIKADATLAHFLQHKVDAAVFGDETEYGNVAYGEDMDGNVHNYTKEEEPSLTIDALAEVMQELAAKGPIPSEIWFVDCRDHYVAFTQSLPYKRVTHSDIGAGTMFSLDMRVIEWYMRHFNPDTETIARKDEGPEERQRLRDEYDYEQVWPWFCAIPGIWVRMNDGSVRRIGPNDLQWERFKYWVSRQPDDK